MKAYKFALCALAFAALLAWFLIPIIFSKPHN